MQYNKNGFTGANKDTLIKDMLLVIKASSNKFVRVLFPEPVDEDNKVCDGMMN